VTIKIVINDEATKRMRRLREALDNLSEAAGREGLASVTLGGAALAALLGSLPHPSWRKIYEEEVDLLLEREKQNGSK